MTPIESKEDTAIRPVKRVFLYDFLLVFFLSGKFSFMRWFEEVDEVEILFVRQAIGACCLFRVDIDSCFFFLDWWILPAVRDDV